MQNPDAPSDSNDDLPLARLADLSAQHAGGRAPVSADQGWQMLVARVPSLGQPHEASKPHVPGSLTHSRSTHRIARPTAWYAAAGIVLGALLLIIGWRVGEHRVKTTLATRVSTYTTARGERAAITLPDSSTVILDVASRLDVPANYAAGNRTLHLTGEAIFTVAHHSGTPFTVIAGNQTTRVLGTSFLVRHYTTDTTTTVAVRDGKVATQSTILTAAQELIATAHNTGRVQPADLSQFSFATGVLTLPSMSLADAITELNRWYDADIRLADPRLGADRIDGQFTAGSLADLAEHLAWTFNVRVVRDGRTITLYPR